MHDPPDFQIWPQYIGIRPLTRNDQNFNTTAPYGAKGTFTDQGLLSQGISCAV